MFMKKEIKGIYLCLYNLFYTTDNSCIESFHVTNKKECIYAEANVGYKDFQTCYDSIFKYIEGFYNSRRHYSKLNYLCPNEFEKQIA